MHSDTKTVAVFLKALPDEVRKSFAKLRAIIRKAVPDARESMKFGMASYELNCNYCAFARQ